MQKPGRNFDPKWWLRLKVIFWSIIITNVVMSLKTKCFSGGLGSCMNPEYVGQNYLWSAGGFVIAMLIMFVYDCWTLESNGEAEDM